MKKFELVPEMSIYLSGRKLFRIRALIDFTTKWDETIHIGDLGGYVEKEENLSHEGNAWVSGDAWVSGNARVYGDAWVSGDAWVYGNAWVYGDAMVCGNAWVSDNAEVYGNARVCDDAEVYKRDHILAIGPIGSRNATTTFFRDKDNEITVSCGCFLGKIDNFLQKVKETHGESKHGRVYRIAAELAKAQIDLEG